MRKMKRALIIAAVAVLSLTACSSGGTAKTETNAGEQKENTDVSVDAEKTKISIWTVDRHDADFMQSKVDEYNKNNTDNIFVEYSLYTENYLQAIDMAFQNGEAPDLMKYHEQTFPKYVGSGKFVDLTTYMSEEQKTKFSPMFFDGINKIGDKIYYIPTTGTTGRLFYNKEIFERCGITKVPETMDEMVETATAITSQLSGEGIYGFAANMKSPASALSRSLGFAIGRDAGIRMGYDFAKGAYDFSGYEPMLKAWKELMSPACVFPGSESLDIDPLRTQFAAGKIGMYISFTHAEPGVYKNQFPMDESKWACAQLPTITGQAKGAQDFVAGSGVLINAEGKNIDAAWKVYEALWLDEEILTEYFEAGLGISIVDSVIERANMAEVYKNNEALLISDTDKLWPMSPHEKDSSAVLIEGQDVYSTFGSMLLGDLDIKEGLDDLTVRYNKAYNDAVSAGEIEAIKIEGFDPMNPLP